MKPESTEISSHWRRWLAGLGLTALALVGIGEKYPLTPFPMYSNIDAEADVLYVVDQNAKPVAMSALFGVGSAQAKKRFEKELLLVAKTRKYAETTPQNVATAGAAFLKELWAGRNAKKVAEAGISSVQARLITVRVAAGGGFDRQEQTLASYTP